MDRCQHCQEQMLDYLYDLLDGVEQEALEAHLADCDACRQELTAAREQQQLLAAAARQDCRPGRFVIPTEHRPAALDTSLPQPEVLRLPLRTSLPQLRPWMVVAAALLLLLGVGLYARYDQENLTRQAEQYQLAWNQSRAEVTAVQARRADVARHQQQELARLAQRESREELQVQVTVPQVLAGKDTAPPVVETRDAKGRAVSAQLKLELMGSRGERRALALDPAGNPVWPNLEGLLPGEYSLVISAENPGDARVQLAVPVRVPAPQVITYLSTDRPIYHAGVDVVHYRSLSLDRRTLQPVSVPLLLDYVLRKPDGREIPLAHGTDRLRNAGASLALLNGPDGKPLTGIGTGSFPLDANLPSGEYAIVVREGQGRFPETATRFLIHRTSQIRFQGEPTWGRPTYRPGEAIDFSAHLTRASGELLRGKLVTAYLLVDGRVQPGAQGLMTDADGRVRIQSRVPPHATRAALVLAMQEGNTTEELRTAVPLYLPSARVEFFPEGGDLIAGLENRVYFQARDRRGIPVALTGELLENDRPTGIRIGTEPIPEVGENSGLGNFRFTPRPDVRYSVRVLHPAETPNQRLPAVQREGVQLTIPTAVVEAGQPLEVQARSLSPRRLRAVLTSRDEVLEVVSLSPQTARAVFSPRATQAVRGVCRVTIVEEVALLGHELPGPVLAVGLLDPTLNPLMRTTLLLAGAQEPRLELIPRAERLVYCRPAERLQLDARADLDSANGERARLTLRAGDENRKAVAAIAQIGIVDRATLTGTGSRFARSLPAQAWLAAELPDPDLLEWADVLLLPRDASRDALDLVLATQGWRRFDSRPGQVGGEPLVTASARHLPDLTALARERSGLLQTTAEHQHALNQRESAAREHLRVLEEDPAFATVLARLTWYRELAPRFQAAAVFLLLGLLVALFALVFYRLIQGEASRSRPYLALTAGAAALLLLVLGPGSAPVHEQEFAELPQQLDARIDVAERPQPQLPGENTLAHVWVLDGFGTTNPAEEERGFGRGIGNGSAKTGFAAPLGKPQAVQAGIARMAGPANDRLDFESQTRKRDLRADALALNQAEAAPPAPVPLTETDKAAQADSTYAFRRQLLEELAKNKMAPSPSEASAMPQAKTEKDFQRQAQPLVVRVFANDNRKQPESKRVGDGWTPLVYWHPVLILPQEGAVVEFSLGNSSLGYQIEIQAHSLDGRLGNLRQVVPRPEKK